MSLRLTGPPRLSEIPVTPDNPDGLSRVTTRHPTDPILPTTFVQCNSACPYLKKQGFQPIRDFNKALFILYRRKQQDK